MERLTYITIKGKAMGNSSIGDILGEFTEHEDLDEKDLLLRSLCNIGDTVYSLSSKCDKCEEDDCYKCPYYNGRKWDDIFVYDIVVKTISVFIIILSIL